MRFVYGELNYLIGYLKCWRVFIEFLDIYFFRNCVCSFMIE